MKALYSQFKELIPGLKAGAKQIGEAMTLTGFMMDSLEEVVYKGKKDYLMGFEVRQNRGDCFSAIGLAREAAAFYGLKTQAPKAKPIKQGKEKLKIKIESKETVKRVLAVKIDGLENKESPAWLKEYLKFYGLNSINLLVDLSNYVMMLTGYPSHLIDFKKTDGQLSWALNSEFNSITTLFGTTVALSKKEELIIKDGEKIIALAGLVGGKEAAIDMDSDSIIAEVAVYNGAIIRKNSRSLNIVTEAGHRLEKGLDSDGAEYAMNLLVSLILEHAKGKVSSEVFSFYPKKQSSRTIKFEPGMAGDIAGVEIPEKEILKIFKNLNFKAEKIGKNISVKVPSYRLDVAMPEDLAEEVARIYGYDKIPGTQPPKLKVTPKITPKNIILAEKIRDILTSLAFDEILSWPLTPAGLNEQINYRNWNKAVTQNSMNELFPELRQSMAAGLLNQLKEYSKKNVEFIDIFEIGKVFGEKNGKYSENDSLGIMSVSNKKTFNEFKNKTENLLRLIGLDGINYFEPSAKPAIANPASCWRIASGKNQIGIIYKLVPQENSENIYFAEINIAKTVEILSKPSAGSTVELNQKLIPLDANIELDISESIFEYLEEAKKKIGKNRLWSIDVTDAYKTEDKIKYTIRASYQEITDQEAKKIHLEAFNLNPNQQI
ncbi:MAG: phenylalanine--tRNA ligase subunit beta [Candidatus Pacebacteria bacterium]|nr:phenylalanine--tRNA ligase subunit beta [Candidatus Paceibacterota bacterium]